MANNHYPLNEEFEVNMTFKVKLTSVSDYSSLSNSQIESAVKDFRKEIEDFIRSKVINQYYREEITEYIDDYTFEIQ